jgi:hypothetical protein
MPDLPEQEKQPEFAGGETTSSDRQSAGDPLAACFRARQLDLALRLLLSLSSLALVWHEVGLLAASVAFLYVFLFVPRLTSQSLTLSSGRTANRVIPRVSRRLYGARAGTKVLEVSYTCSCADVYASELQEEFEEVCLTALFACDCRNLSSAEVTAEMPASQSFFSFKFLRLTARSAEFEKDNRGWRLVDPKEFL